MIQFIVSIQGEEKRFHSLSNVIDIVDLYGPKHIRKIEIFKNSIKIGMINPYLVEISLLQKGGE